MFKRTVKKLYNVYNGEIPIKKIELIVFIGYSMYKHDTLEASNYMKSSLDDIMKKIKKEKEVV